MSGCEAVLASLEAELGWIGDTYIDLHRHPELSLEEQRTSKLVEGKLAEFGYAVTRVGGTGVVGVLANGNGPTVLARGDTDALPVTEATGLPYASAVDGVMHACGHDLHAAALLGAAKLMADGRAAWSGTYIALFQPGEEIGAGSQAMLDDGLVAKVPRPDVAFAQHVMPIPAGTVATTAGPVLSAADSLRITVYGKGAHGSMPHMSVDPVVLASAIVLRLQSVVSRETKPGDFAVVTVGALNAGATANIIPDLATLLLNIRTYDTHVRASVLAAIERIVKGECSAAGSPKSPEFEYYDQFPLTSNDAIVTEKVRAAFSAHFGAHSVRTAQRQTASEDFSRIPDAFGVPYTFWLLGGVDPENYRAAVERGTVAQDIPANHSPLFAPVIDPALSIGVQAHVVAAMSYLATEGATQ
ncbi:amidohydrolase [Arthrobacter bambusae]|uniref:amidohydrolase n=1 Tax=Arthrobacter bambusae TaxID=1338426 RepID=UPI00277D797D|nr:amidohydrolase [Arthrobacter bambusae]MDQ0029399.1 hippurate hydrolase [Arthrobacter bambusae]MDQ0097059.1 hippurate hydrolase [Arthrobacter bambusae]